MRVSDDEIRRELREFLLREFLPGESSSTLTDETPLLTEGILDSISVLRFVMFLEKRFRIKLRGQDLAHRHLRTVASVIELVRSKIGRD